MFYDRQTSRQTTNVRCSFTTLEELPMRCLPLRAMFTRFLNNPICETLQEEAHSTSCRFEGRTNEMHVQSQGARLQRCGDGLYSFNGKCDDDGNVSRVHFTSCRFFTGFLGKRVFMTIDYINILLILLQINYWDIFRNF